MYIMLQRNTKRNKKKWSSPTWKGTSFRMMMGCLAGFSSRSACSNKYGMSFKKRLAVDNVRVIALVSFIEYHSWFSSASFFNNGGPKLRSQYHLEVGAAGRQDHLVSLCALPVAGDGHIRERLLVPQVLEARHHVSLEVVPAEAELLLIVHGWSASLTVALKYPPLKILPFSMPLMTISIMATSLAQTSTRHWTKNP